MDGIKINGINLFLTEIPGRKGLAFCFEDGTALYPVAYVSDKLKDMAIEKWSKMIERRVDAQNHSNPE